LVAWGDFAALIFVKLANIIGNMSNFFTTLLLLLFFIKFVFFYFFRLGMNILDWSFFRVVT